MNNFYVIRIVDEYRLLINAGEKDVKPSTMVEVYDEDDVITDPMTGEELGRIPLILARLVVVKTYERFSLCETKKHKINLLNLSNDLTLAGIMTETTRDTLPVDTFDMKGFPSVSMRNIKLGDKVRILPTEDPE